MRMHVMLVKPPPQPVDVSPCLCDTLRRTSRVVTRIYDEFLRPLDLRVTQFAVLHHLEVRGETRLSDLAETLRFEQTTLVRGLRPLEERGWVRSRPGHDRRERHVSITPEGSRLLAKARPLWKRAQSHLRERVSAPPWEALFKALPRVAAAAHELALGR